jgi:HSP20 family molecular chaperone IbpA
MKIKENIKENLKPILLASVVVLIFIASCIAGKKTTYQRPVLVVYDNFDFPFLRLQQRMNQFFNEADREFSFFEQGFVRIDAFVDDGKFQLVADLPGFSKDDLAISISNGYLIIKGEHKQEKEKQEQKKSQYYLNERSGNMAFNRRILLPRGANIEKADTNFADGILKITIPINEIPKPEILQLKINS